LQLKHKAHAWLLVCLVFVLVWYTRAPAAAAVEWPGMEEMLDACTKGLSLQAEFEVWGPVVVS
jgi:hypothetical protein